MKRIFLISLMVLMFIGLALGQETSTEPVSEVQIEEYIPKVIIEGKWGTGAGEFGIDGAYLEEGRIVPKGQAEPVYPRSLAVDSKGNIYILDIVNNRIQKFNNQGDYFLSIPIESWEGYLVGKPKGVKGINIVIDSQDNLYYYCVKGEKGEVWQFKDDELKKKWEVPVVDKTGLYIEEERGELCLYDEGKQTRYYVFGKKHETKMEAEQRRKNHELKARGNLKKNDYEFKIKVQRGNIAELEIAKPNKEIISIKIPARNQEGKVTIFKHSITKENLYEVLVGFYGQKDGGEVKTESRLYDLNGNLIKIIKEPNLVEPKPKITTDIEDTKLKILRWNKSIIR